MAPRTVPATSLACTLALLAACREAPVEAPADLCAARPAAPAGEVRLTARCGSDLRPPAPGPEALALPPLRALAALEARGALGELAAAWFWRGDLRQAAAYLRRSPPSLDRDSDLAAVAVARGQPGEALALVDGVLERRADHPQALWNRALALRDLGLPLTAAASFERVAALGEPGWSGDARDRAAALRRDATARERAWKAVRDALAGMVGGAAPSLPVEALARFPGTAREQLYEVLRAAPGREQARALLPLAEALDRASGGTSLRGEVLQVAGADFARRGPLAKEYAQLVAGKHLDPAALVARLRRSAEKDLLFGALLRAPAVERRADEVESLARTWDDPWLQLDAQMELARLDALEGRHEASDRRLREGLERCAAAHLPFQCLKLARTLSHDSTSANHLPEAEALGRAYLRDARALGEWGMEGGALLALAQAYRFQLQGPVARAMLLEALARSPADPKLCSYVHRNLTVFALGELRVEEAREELDRALGCGAPVTLVGAWALSELGRLSPEPTDGANLEKALGELSPNVETKGRQVLATLFRGRFAILSDRAAGERLLRQAIAASAPMLDTDADARDAWALSFKELALDAARREDWPGALAVLAERLHVPAPPRCALGVVADAERTAAVAVGADGAQLGSYDHSRRAPLGSSLEGLVPAPLVAALQGCPRVEVLTVSPLDTRAGLLPAELAWSYRVGNGRVPALRQAPRHLVVSDVEAPASLHLPRLAPWNVPGPPSGATVSLTGAGATPARVLAEMQEATTIDVHAHGLVNPLLSGATAIALAPEADGRYALTAEAIGASRLEGGPVVSLAACAAAWRPAFIHETFSLPQAFVEAGARAVLASTVDIPDSAGAFFSEVRERIQAGTEPAVALRDERVRWRREDPAARWVEDVLLYE